MNSWQQERVERRLAYPSEPFRSRTALGQGRLSSSVDEAAGLPSAPEMPCAPRQLRLVPTPDIALAACRRSAFDSHDGQ